jgi:hypothetical protein
MSYPAYGSLCPARPDHYQVLVLPICGISDLLWVYSLAMPCSWPHSYFRVTPALLCILQRHLYAIRRYRSTKYVRIRYCLPAELRTARILARRVKGIATREFNLECSSVAGVVGCAQRDAPARFGLLRYVTYVRVLREAWF